MFFSKKEKKKEKKDNFVYLLEFKKILSSFQDCFVDKNILITFIFSILTSVQPYTYARI